MKALFAAAVGSISLLSTAASAQLGSVNEPAPGYSSLLNSDYASAAREIEQSSVPASDPARLINSGIALAKSGDRIEAAKQFREVLLQDEVQLVVASGRTLSSHEVAKRALEALRDGPLAD